MPAGPLWAGIAMVVVQIGFGGYGIVLKKFAQAAHENAVVFSFFRDGCCFPVLLAAAVLIEGGPKVPKSRKELLTFLGLGVTGMWGNQLFYILGLYYTNATIASCWQPSIPVFAAVMAIILGVEPFPPLSKVRGWLKIVGILLAAGGALVLALSKPGGGGAHYKLDHCWPKGMPDGAATFSAVGVDHLGEFVGAALSFIAAPFASLSTPARS
jgi:drug/metabolite transporter (DMT)-like permease|eukprot:COSAG01_NODE_4693_length_4808_cov_6.865152_2_plen_212_part_00